MSAVAPSRRQAIVPQHATWFRVMRMYRIGAAPVQFECIAETAEPGPASVIATQESGRAVVTRWDSKRVFDNGKEIESRPAEDAGTTKSGVSF